MAVAVVRWVAVRRQSLVALALVVAVVIDNARSSPDDTEWQAVALAAAVLALLCMSPVAFASSRRSYRAAAAAVAILLTIAAVHGLITGNVSAVPAAVLGWLTTAPVRQARVE
jgi:hypothetical protein